MRICSQKCAREIMGKNFFGIKEAVKHFGVNPSKQQLASLAKVPFPEAVLKKLKNTHVLVAVFPFSIIEIGNKKVAQEFFRYFYEDERSDAEKRVFEEHGETNWQLVCKTPVKNSYSNDWGKQQALLGKGGEVPAARVMIYAIIGHYLATGECLFWLKKVRTSSLVCDGVHVFIGVFPPMSFIIGTFGDEYRSGYIGVSSARVALA